MTEAALNNHPSILLSGLIGKKIGMSRMFAGENVDHPITLIQIAENCILQVKDGSVVLGYKLNKAERINKPQRAELLSKNLPLMSKRIEFSSDIGASKPEDITGTSIDVVTLSALVGQLLDVRGKTKGKGFAGGIKRHGFKGNRGTEASLVKRSIGSTGQRQDPGKVFKGKKMPGRMGQDYRTIAGLKVLFVDPEMGVIGVKGSIPGSTNEYVSLTPSRLTGAGYIRVGLQQQKNNA